MVLAIAWSGVLIPIVKASADRRYVYRWLAAWKGGGIWVDMEYGVDFV